MKRTLLSSFLLCAVLASAAGAEEPETLRYRWNLGGFFGSVLRLFLPGRGDGTLVTRSDGSGTTEVELDITAPAAKRGEYWHYGARINAADGRTLRAWSAYEFRGKKGSKESDFDDEAVIDVASGILLLRRDPPAAPRNMKIWNDGKIYPIVILPRGLVKRTVLGRKVAVRHFAIRARRVP
ncbi:MAG: hypothetical protein O7A04_12160, partial [Acidobacteria bacterium]|nr:hypothetical protein [Acidobacteriota bacterium]